MVRKDYVKRFLITALLAVGMPIATFAKAPEVTVPHQYPKKYTPEYISQITPAYKDVGKDEVFYVALDMLKDTEVKRTGVLYMLRLPPQDIMHIITI